MTDNLDTLQLQVARQREDILDTVKCWRQYGSAPSEDTWARLRTQLDVVVRNYKEGK